MDATPDRAARLVEESRSALHDYGLTARFEIQPGEGGWLVHVDFDSEDGLTLEVSPMTDDVRVLDPHDENMSESQWFVYVVARAQGQSPRDASRMSRRSRRGRGGTPNKSE
ncbi:hypothetical protein ABZ402_42050 [Streptomyces mirabilis]|uniref:hypothetical protein n=1 Tax=Streptomyces mirabilis TaxID=68239 RepID=UPI0033CC1417